MPSTTLPFALPATPTGAPAAARAVFGLLKKLRVGTLDLQAPDGTQARFGNGDEPRAALRLADWRVCGAALKSGDIGFAQSWIAGSWHTPDLVALLKLFIANRSALEEAIYGTLLGRLGYRVQHRLNRNSRRGSKHNVHAHYDIGNAFYRLWLDETMNYSAALFNGDRSQPLPQAQRAKLRRVLSECRLEPGQRLLEIGCGWGPLAEAAATDFDAHVTGVTLSSEQLAYAQQRQRQAGVSDRVELRLQDYRDITDEPFDAIASIEMFEAVGREYWPGFFAMLKRQLKPGGHACIQSITIRDDLFERYAAGTDFIQQYIFPGGLLPSASAFRAEAAKVGLEVVNELAFGPDYAETLRRWRVGFLRHATALKQQGFDTRFLRIWEFYLVYCEAAFDTGNTNVVQFTLRKPG